MTFSNVSVAMVATIILLVADIQLVRGLRHTLSSQPSRSSHLSQLTLQSTRQSITMASNSVIEEGSKGQPRSKPNITTSAVRSRSTAGKTDEKLKRDLVALKTFFRLHGHYRVPYTYVIPNGTSVRSTNGRIRRKSALGSTHTSEGAPAAPALPAVDDGERCVSESYPSETHGLRLGLRVARIRKGELYPQAEQRARLAEIGWNLDLDLDHVGPRSRPSAAAASSATTSSTTGTAATSTSTSTSTSTGADDEFDRQLQWSARAHTTDQKFHLIMSALKVHNDLYGDLLVPRYFVVPAEDPWPPATWNMQLGNRVRNIRARRAYDKPRYHQQLTEVGFVFTLGDCQIHTSWSGAYSTSTDDRFEQ